MKKLALLLILLSALLTSQSVFAGQSVVLSPITFQINATNALSKFEQTVLYPERLLNRYRPVGATISHKKVSQNVISFIATKSVLFLSKSVYVNGIFESSIDSRACSKGETGYQLRMSFDSSDRLVTDNVDGLEATVCLQSQSPTKLSGVVRSKVILGNNYSNTLGPIALSLIKEQVGPLINALTEEIKSLN